MVHDFFFMFMISSLSVYYIYLSNAAEILVTARRFLENVDPTKIFLKLYKS